MKKFTESIKSLDLFSNEETLRDILLEYSDSGFKWSISYKLFKTYNDGDGEWFMPFLSSASKSVKSEGQLWIKISSSLYDIFDTNDENFPDGAIRGYHISFTEVFDKILANDKQRGDNRRNFAIPNDKLYTFFQITKDIQDRIESMGYTFLLSVHQNAEFDIIIIEK
jgi:hypothetical protein